MNSEMTLGRKIAQLRKEKGMTQLELAGLMGVTDKAVSKWERDLSCPDITTLPRLAEVLGVSVDELLQCDGSLSSSTQEEGGAVKYVSLALQAVGMAMGIAVAVSSVLGSTDYRSSAILLGTGLACLGIYSFVKK